MVVINYLLLPGLSHMGGGLSSLAPRRADGPAETRSFKVSSEQIAMLLRQQQPTDVAVEAKEKHRVEDIQEKLVKDDSGRIHLEEVVGNSLFDKRGIICGFIGLIVGIVFGVLGTAVMLG